MKKIIAVLLALVLVVGLAACGKSEAAKSVDALIEAIGSTITLSSESAIKTAETAYNALPEGDKSQVEGFGALIAARAALDELIAEEEARRIQELQQAAADVDAMIAAIGSIDLNSGEVIAAARAAYDALSEEAKGYVSQLTTLEGAEAELVQLQVQTATDLIAAIGKVTLDSNSAIKAASQMYSSLPAEVQAMVENASVLTEASQTYADLAEKEVNKLLSKLQVEKDEVRGINFYYASTFPYYKSYGYWGADVRCFVLPYMGVQGNNVWLRMVCDYTADDWVFFKKITFAVDDQRYYKYFNYFDVVRDNAYGDIWEYVDIEVGESEVALLEAIANSEKTIIRFEGDDYYDDFTVTEKDKKAIKEMLMIYEYLKNK